ncbi:MAG TPA: V-type ATP synthase subunit K [Spirochaetota bacterium]|nr:V-type ATP synthase subunit K [Spirochaetota bacterium]HNT12057.1 V-type ATP synthase subunit K [Spirochaetota bacterium]HOS39928.1 V-type ATP synthase subunit K [Spirochaetota bacterium]
MDASIGQIAIGAVLGLSACGSAAGAGVGGMAAIGAWKKCLVQNRPVPFLLVAFVGAPLSQTIYGMILMNAIAAAQNTDPLIKLGVGVFGGLAIGASAFYQGKAGASGSDALAETGKGFGNYIMVVGIIETVALFVMVFLLGMLK